MMRQQSYDVKCPEPLSEAEGCQRSAGINQSLKLIKQGKAKRILLANDADAVFTEKVMKEIKAHYSGEVVSDYNSKQLAEMLGIEVDCAIITEY